MKQRIIAVLASLVPLVVVLLLSSSTVETVDQKTGEVVAVQSFLSIAADKVGLSPQSLCLLAFGVSLAIYAVLRPRRKKVVDNTVHEIGR